MMSIALGEEAEENHEVMDPIMDQSQHNQGHSLESVVHRIHLWLRARDPQKGPKSWGSLDPMSSWNWPAQTLFQDRVPH